MRSLLNKFIKSKNAKVLYFKYFFFKYFAVLKKNLKKLKKLDI